MHEPRFLLARNPRERLRAAIHQKFKKTTVQLCCSQVDSMQSPAARIKSQHRNCATVLLRMQLLPQLHQGCPLATFVLRSLFDPRHVRMALQELAHAAPQNPGPVSVNHAHLR